MGVAEVRYANVSAEALSNSVGPSKDQEDSVAEQKLKQALARGLKKGEEQKRVEGKTPDGAPRTSKSDALFKGLAEGKAGPTGKAALEMLQKSVLADKTSGLAKEVFGETTQKTPQVGFEAASSFQRMTSGPGADKALAPVASEALVVTTQTAQKGDKELKKLEEAVGEFAKSFGHDDASPTVKKRMFKATTDAPGTERHKLGVEFGGSKSLKLMNGPAQESIANKFLKADPNNPKDLKDTLKGLEKIAQDPKLLSPKLNSADMKANFSNLSKAVSGGNKLSVSLEAQEKILASSKFHAMPMEARAKIQAAVGKAPQQADDVAHSLGQVRDGRLGAFARKVTQRGTEKAALQQIVGECKAREIAFPPIEPFEEGEGQGGDPEARQKYNMAAMAKISAAAQKVKRHNERIGKSLNKCTSLKQLNELETSRSLAPLKGNFKTPQEFATHHKCTLEVAEHVFRLDTEVERHRSQDLQLSKLTAAKRRSLRGKPERLTERMDKRAPGAVLPAKTTITLSDDAATTSTASLKKMLAKSGTPTKTQAAEPGEASVTAAPTKEEIKSRNSQQTVRPGSITMGGLKNWGNNAMPQLGLDPNQKQKLAKMREDKIEAARQNPELVKGGPMIGRASDFLALSEVVANETTWRDLSPGMKAALRNLQITPNILDSWRTNKPVYSSLQARPWEELKEIQRKSAQLVSLSAENWNALASSLSSAIKQPRNSGTDNKRPMNFTQVQMKGKA